MNVHSLYIPGLIVLVCLLSMTLGVLALYAHTIMPGLKKTDDETFVKAFQAIDRAIINPIFMTQFFAPLLLAGVLCWQAFANNYSEALLLAIACAIYLVGVIVTMAVNVPLNDAIKAANPSGQGASAQVRATFNESRWVSANGVRLLTTLIATILVGVALAIH